MEVLETTPVDGNWNIPRYLFGHVYRRTDVHHVTDQTPAGRAVMTDLPVLTEELSVT